jgi:hypothetical protein
MREIAPEAMAVYRVGARRRAEQERQREVAREQRAWASAHQVADGPRCFVPQHDPGGAAPYGVLAGRIRQDLAELDHSLRETGAQRSCRATSRATRTW